MTNPYAQYATSGASPGEGNPYAQYAPSAVGVQDWEPAPTPEPTIVDRVNKGVNWLGTRATKAGTGILGAPRALADLARTGLEAIAGPQAMQAIINANPLLAVSQYMPSTQSMNALVFDRLGVPEVSSKSRVGRVVDAGAEAALGSVVLPGSVLRNVLPAAIGGASQEAAGQVVEGSPWDPVVRLVAGVGAGVGAAGVQNALGNVAQGVRNIAPNVDKTAAKIVGRAMERDNVTGSALAQRQAELGEGATLVEAGGQNVRGTLRGAIAAPGRARTATQDAFDARVEGSNTRTTGALDKSISPNGSLATTVDELSSLRAQQAGPLYEAAGIPKRVQQVETTRPGEPVKRTVSGPGGPAEITEAGAPIVERGFNTPNFSTPQLEFYLKNSPDVQAAIGAARRLPEYKDLPANSMVMLDKAYKHLSGMEQEAVRAGNNTRARDLNILRQGFQKALTDANPDYQKALDAFSGPSKLIDAATRAKEWFTKNVDPVIVGREYEAMKAAGLDDAALIGVRDWARTMIGRSDRGVAAERVWNGGDNRARLEKVLTPQGFKDLARSMESEKNLIRTSRDINVGSRTTPMALEAADNAMQTVGAASDLARGRIGSVLTNALGGLVERVWQGKTEAVNNRIAEILTSSDPNQVGLVAALLEQARRQELARSQGRINALTFGGGVAPMVNALGGGR